MSIGENMYICRHIKNCLLFLFVSFICLVPKVLSQHPSCDNALKRIPGNLGYSWRSGRCEGFYESQVSSKLELVSLTIGKIQYVLEENINLEVTTPFGFDEISEPIYLRAIALPLRTYYRLDTIIQHNGRFIWPIKDVLIPAKLTANRLGVFAWIDNNDDKIFVPVIVTCSSSKKAENTNSPILLMIRSDLEIEGLVWRSYSEKKELTKSLKWEKVLNSPQRAGKIITISLPNGPSDILNINIRAKAVNRDKWLTLDFKVKRKGQNEK